MGTNRTSRRKTASTNDDRRFWRILTKTTAANTLPFTRSNLSALGDLHVQFFEVLVTETLADFCPSFTWCTTQLVGDDGIDLQGHAALVECKINRTRLSMAHVVLGQVKRSREYEFDRAVGMIEKIILGARKRRLPISQLIIVISGDGTTPQRYRRMMQRHAWQRLPGVPIKVIDAADLVACWEADPQRIAQSLAPALKNADDVSFIEDYLFRRRRARRPADRWSVVPDPPVGARVRGAVLDVSITIKAPLTLPGHEIAVAWWPGSGIQVVRPLAALADTRTDNCVRMVLEHDGRARFPVRFRATVAGTIDLGELEIVEGTGESRKVGKQPQRFPLGEIVIDKGFDLGHVPYLPMPHDASAREFDASLDLARAGGIEVIALVGPGGIGKTRLVDEIVDGLQNERPTARRTDGRQPHLPVHLRVEHATDRNGTARFLLDIALALAGPELEAGTVDIGRQRILGDPGEALRNWLALFTSGQQNHADAAIEALLGRGERSNPAAVVLLLMQCLIARTRNGPILLHLANLHWSTSFEIAVLGELIRRLREIAPSVGAGVLIILEGRTKEMVSRTGGPETTDAWGALLALPDVVSVRLDMWSERHSADFLKRVLRHIGLPRNASHDEDALIRDPVWRRLQAHVLGASSGNPMHIIEHVRLLLTTRVLEFDADGALIVSGVPSAERAGRSLRDMIMDRAEYVRRDPSYAEVIASLKILAELGLAVDRTLFETVTNVVTDSRYRARLEEIQVARLPGAGSDVFQFVHETYRAAFRELPWQAQGGGHLRRAVLQRLEPVEKLPPHRLVAWSRIKRFDTACPLDEVRDALLGGLDRAERSFEFEGIASLCDELLALPDYVVDGGERPVREIRQAFAHALMGAGNWEKALQQLELAALRRSSGRDEDVFQGEVAHERGNVLGDMLRCAEAIPIVHAGLEVIERWDSTADDERVQICREMLLNRLGVLQWFSGRADLGIASQWKALQSARRHDPGGEREILFLTEVGTVMLHRYPHRGRSMLERANRFLAQHRHELSPGLDYVEAQFQMARLLVPSESDSLQDIERRCVDIAEGRNRRASIYGALLAWLMAGAAAFRLNRLAASEDYFAEALWLANVARHKRAAWKIHLALAANLSAQGRPAPARTHACLAADILIESLDLVGAPARPRWAATIRLPLESARRILGAEPYTPLESCLTELDAGSPPRWTTDWASRPRAQSKASEPFQILHVREGEYDVFLMG